MYLSTEERQFLPSGKGRGGGALKGWILKWIPVELVVAIAPYNPPAVFLDIPLM